MILFYIFIVTLILPRFQIDFLWYCDETVCRIQHLRKVTDHHQVFPENVE